MVALLHPPRAEVFATTANWLSLLGLSVPQLPSPAHRNRATMQFQVQVPPKRSMNLTWQLSLEELGPLGLSSLPVADRHPVSQPPGLLELLSLEGRVPWLSCHLRKGCCFLPSQGKAGVANKGNVGQSPRAEVSSCPSSHGGEAASQQLVRLTGVAWLCVQAAVLFFCLLKFTRVLKTPGDFVLLPK